MLKSRGFNTKPEVQLTCGSYGNNCDSSYITVSTVPHQVLKTFLHLQLQSAEEPLNQVGGQEGKKRGSKMTNKQRKKLERQRMSKKERKVGQATNMKDICSSVIPFYFRSIACKMGYFGGCRFLS